MNIKINNFIMNIKMQGLSGLPNTKDTDREILLRLSDNELIKTCSLNKYLLNNVCDDNFFKRRLQLTYPDTLRFYNEYKLSLIHI